MGLFKDNRSMLLICNNILWYYKLLIIREISKEYIGGKCRY